LTVSPHTCQSLCFSNTLRSNILMGGVIVCDQNSG
jgi:hypothetical protein